MEVSCTIVGLQVSPAIKSLSGRNQSHSSLHQTGFIRFYDSCLGKKPDLIFHYEGWVKLILNQTSLWELETQLVHFFHK